MNLTIVSTDELTFCSTDSKKIPDLLIFGITKSILKNSYNTESCLELSSDYSTIIITLNSNVITRSKSTCTLHNAKTLSYFHELLTTTLNNSIPLKTDDDIIYAAESLNHAI